MVRCKCISESFSVLLLIICFNAQMLGILISSILSLRFLTLGQQLMFARLLFRHVIFQRISFATCNYGAGVIKCVQN